MLLKNNRAETRHRLSRLLPKPKKKGRQPRLAIEVLKKATMSWIKIKVSPLHSTT